MKEKVALRFAWRTWLRLPLRSLIQHEFSITEGSALLMVGFIFSAVLGIVRQILFNARFGTSFEASAYYAAFRLPDTITTLLAGGTLANAMIPVLLAVAKSEGEEAAYHVVRRVLSVLMILVVCVVVGGIFFAPLFVRVVLAPGFNAETSRLSIILTQMMLLDLIFIVFSSVASTVLNSRSQFLLPTIANAVHNLALIGGIVAAMIYPPIGVYGPTVGIILDAALQLLILSPGLWRIGLRFEWAPSDARLRQVGRLLVPNGLSSLVNYAGAIVDTHYGSKALALAGIPALQNAWLLIGLPIRMLGLAIGQAAFPRLAAYAVAKDWLRMRHVLRWVLAISVGLSLVASGAFVMFGRLAISVIFEWGRFDVRSGDLTYAILVAYALGLPAYIATEMLGRGLIALQDTRTPLITNCIQLTSRVGMIIFGLPTLDILAIPFAFAVSSALETLLLGVVLFARIRARLLSASPTPPSPHQPASVR